MKKTGCLLIFFFVLCPALYAQETPNVEVFGGYSYLTNSNDEDLHGWSGSVNKNLNSWVGLKAEVSGYYSRYVDFAGDKLSVNHHLILGGAQFTYRKHEKIQPFGHILIGSVFTSSSVTAGGSTLSASGSGLAFVAGGGVDYKIAKAIAIRLIQADYVYTKEDGFNTDAFRISAGLVFRAGEK